MFGIVTGGEGNEVPPLGTNDARRALDESIPQRADALYRPEARSCCSVLRSRRSGANLKLATESVGDKIAEHVDLVTDLAARWEVTEPELGLGLGKGGLLRSTPVVEAEQRGSGQRLVGHG